MSVELNELPGGCRINTLPTEPTTAPRRAKVMATRVTWRIKN